MARFRAEEADNYGGQGGGGFFSIANDKEVKQVRFMYDTVDDIEGMSVHKIKIGDKDRYVNCLREYNQPVDDCPLCRERNPVQARLFIPVYNIDEDAVQIWDRGKTMFSKMTSLCSRYAVKNHLVNNIFEIERNEEEIAVLADIEKTFYENCIVNKHEPPADGEKATTEAINKVFEHSEPGVEVDLGLYKSDVDLYLELKAQRDEIDKLMDDKLNGIKTFMREAERGICGDHKVTWKTQVRNNFDKKRFAAEHPEIDLSQYMKQSISRPFKIS